MKAKIGMRAKGNCRLIRTFNRSFIPLSCPIPSKIDINIVGAIAIVLVSNTLCHLFHFKFRKPCKDNKKTGYWYIMYISGNQFRTLTVNKTGYWCILYG